MNRPASDSDNLPPWQQGSSLIVIAMHAAYLQELTTAVTAAKDAGAIIRDLYERSAASTYIKGDGSPVTDADLASDQIIRATIASAFPEDAILTEEGADDLGRLTAKRCWVVDPIDGTQQFIDRTGQFDVLIALVVNGRPVLGVTYQPTTDLLLTAITGQGAWIEQAGDRRPFRLQPASSPPRLLTSVWLGAPASLPALARVAERIGAATPTVSPYGIYARSLLPPGNDYDALIGFDSSRDATMASEWDFAAADIAIHEAGGAMSDLAGNLHQYNKPIPRNLNGVVLSTDPITHARIIEALRPELDRLP